MPEVNEPRLRGVLAHIEQDQEHWDQYTYGCGTAACLAGWAVALENNWTMGQLFTVNQTGFSIRDRAQELLGLTRDQAHALFSFHTVVDASAPWGGREPTFAEFCERVEEVTGVRYKPLTHLTEADVAG
jgi:hypothetical protein